MKLSIKISLLYVTKLAVWCRGVRVNLTTQLHSTKFDFIFGNDLNPAPGTSEIFDGENL